ASRCGMDWSMTRRARLVPRQSLTSLLESCQQLLQGIELHRLGHVVIEACLLGPPTVFLLPPARQGDQHHALALLLPNAATRFVPIQFRQSDVQQYHVGSEHCRRPDCFQAVMGGVDAKGTQRVPCSKEMNRSLWTVYATVRERLFLRVREC